MPECKRQQTPAFIPLAYITGVSYWCGCTTLSHGTTTRVFINTLSLLSFKSSHFDERNISTRPIFIYSKTDPSILSKYRRYVLELDSEQEILGRCGHIGEIAIGSSRSSKLIPSRFLALASRARAAAAFLALEVLI